MEMLALASSIVAYFVVWTSLDRVLESGIGTFAAGIIIATVVSLAVVPVLLFLGLKIFGVSPGGTGTGH